MNIERFWTEYTAALAANVEAHPELFTLQPPEIPLGYAMRVAAKMRAAVEHRGFGNGEFSRINYRDSRAFRAAARAVGVAFTRAGLNSVYQS